MIKTTRVNLHCHSNYSDGDLSPEKLAERLAVAGVEYAALTDHDSIDGLTRFHDVLKRHNIGFLSGVEMTTHLEGREIHLLAYGFDIHHEEMKSTLQYLRHNRLSRVQGPLRQMPSQHLPELEGEPAPGVAETGKIEIAEAIRLVHRAGGRSFLAHPGMYESESEALDKLIGGLKAAGLDGIEVAGGHRSSLDQNVLRDMARRQSLLISAGTDFHSPGGANDTPLGIDFPTENWKQLVRSLSTTPGPASPPTPDRPHPKTGYEDEKDSQLWSFFYPRIVLPSLLAIMLFITTIWGMVLPSIETLLIDRKRDTIMELTNTALSLLAAAEREERAGHLTRTEAQEKAKSYIGALRYGKEGKDYFWIQDMQPRMIMHPYRADLEGTDVSEFTDPRGIHIFELFATIVRQQEKGFVEYVWQWKDDPGRLAAKESYVSGFAPWGWVIGTGIYTDDVMTEIRRIEKNLVYTLSAIVLLIFLVLLYNVRQSVKVEKKRTAMQASLLDAEERYRSLIEATTEGTLLVLDDRCRYANPTMLQITGYRAERLELLTLSDLLPREPENEAVWAYIEKLPGQAAGPNSFEAWLVHASGKKREYIITLNPIEYAEQPGIIVLAKDLYPSRMLTGVTLKIGQAAQSASIGIFQAKAVQQGVVVAMNTAAQQLFEEVRMTGKEKFTLADLFDDASEYDEVFNTLRKTGTVQDHMIHKITAGGGTRVLSLSATQVAAEQGELSNINCVVNDITHSVRRDNEREAFIEKLGVSLLFLQEPIGNLGVQAAACHLETPIHKAAALITRRGTTCVIVETDDGEPIGFITDHDFRKRVVANKEADLLAPVRTIMSAPLVTVSGQAMIYQALMHMEENKVQHLAVTDASGRVSSVVRALELLQFHRYGPVILLREIARAENADEVARSCKRLPTLVKSLVDAGARPRIVAHMTSAVCDAATTRLIKLAIEELGAPPVPFTFIAMGSQGRQEQTLLTDQDNAIIYQQADDADPETTSAYFLSLGEKVCGWLDRAGYKLCDGKVMASNPKWCRSLPEWKENFSEWMLKAEPKELLDFSICLDFRPVYGVVEMAHELRGFIYEVLKDRPRFLPHLAQNALLFKPPSRLMGRIIKSGGPPEEAGQLNMKEILMPMVGYGRLYALRHRMPHTHTMKRIEALVWKGVLQPSTIEAVGASYDFLMRLRFQAQLSGLEDNQQLDNCIALNKIEHMDEAMLKQAFLQIESLQKKIDYEFFGGGV